MPTVKRYLKGLSKPQLEGLLEALMQRNPQVREYLESALDEKKAKAIFDRYWNELATCFPPLPAELELARARQLLTEYAKVGNDGEVAMQMMGHAALGAQYAYNFGDMDEDFYGEFEESFEAALALAQKHGMVEDFRIPADDVARLVVGTGYGFADEIHGIYKHYFGELPTLEKREPQKRGKRSANATKKRADTGMVVPLNAAPPANNPFGARAPEEVLCIESRPLETRKDGTVWLYLAMDAHTRFAFHQDIKRQSTLPDYFTFISTVLKKHPELKRSKLAVDTSPETVSAFKKLFPHFAGVLCDKVAVAAVTDEFHTAFLAHMGGQGREN